MRTSISRPFDNKERAHYTGQWEKLLTPVPSYAKILHLSFDIIFHSCRQAVIRAFLGCVASGGKDTE